MEDILRKLVAFPSVSGEQTPNQAILDYMAEFVTARGMHVKRFTHNETASFVATTQPNDLTPTLMLVAHVDVVPAPADKFMLRKQNGKYYGRGVFDMKFAAAAFMQLVDRLQDKLAEYDFGLMITTDEEIGGKDGVKYLVNEVGYHPKVCIIPDGGPNWEIEEFAKGVEWIELSSTGVTAHASRPWEGEHAIHKLLLALGEIRTLFPHDSGRKDTLLSVGMIQGGEAANQTADKASAVLDIRHGNMEDYRTSFSRVKAVCDKHDVKAEIHGSAPPCINPPSDPYIRTFREIMKELLGYSPKACYSYAATDGRFFSAINVPCIIMQPPGGDNHAASEWISVEGCEQFYEMICRYAEQIAKRKPSSQPALRPLAQSSKML